MYENYYESGNESDYDEKYDSINKLELNDYDVILDLYYDIQNRFPYFIDKMSFSNLFSLITLEITLDKKCHDENFYCKYSNEIENTFYVLSTYNFEINYNDWYNFCYNFTT